MTGTKENLNVSLQVHLVASYDPRAPKRPKRVTKFPTEFTSVAPAVTAQERSFTERPEAGPRKRKFEERAVGLMAGRSNKRNLDELAALQGQPLSLPETFPPI